MIDISVIIPVYNSHASIERCLESVLNQTYKTTFQIIVINDGSTDDSVDIVYKFIAKKKVDCIEIINKPNGGVASARNLGIMAAKGKWIALLDSDDEWLSEKIERQMSVLNADSAIDFLGCNVTTWSAGFLWYKIHKLSKIKLWRQFISWYPATPTVIFKREIIQDVGLYDESFSHGEDGQFLIRILMKKNCWFIPDKLVYIGGGKPTFGHSGLSANLYAMHKGNVEIIKYAYKEKAINFMQFIVFWMYSILKHWRRIVITKLR